MKIWFEKSYSFSDEVKIGINWSKHKRKEWKGFTIDIIFLKWWFLLHYVDNYKEYCKIINYRYKYQKRYDGVRNRGNHEV